MVDEAATASLRDRMRDERDEPALFDFGPGIDSLRERCEAETGLPAPQQPVWPDAEAAE